MCFAIVCSRKNVTYFLYSSSIALSVSAPLFFHASNTKHALVNT